MLLQNYRDEYLAGTRLGEKFIHTYYRLSPMLARQISRNKILKLLTRGLLAPLILLITRITGATPNLRFFLLINPSKNKRYQGNRNIC